MPTCNKFLIRQWFSWTWQLTAPIMIPVPSSSLRVKKKVFPPLSHFCQLLSFFVNFHSWPHLARARQAGARSWQWPHLGLVSEVIKISRKGEEEVGQKNDQVQNKIRRCWSVTCRSWRTRLCARGERSAGTLWRGKVGSHSKLLNRGGKKQLSGWKCTTIFNISKPPVYNGFYFLPVIKSHNLFIIIVNAEVRVVIHEKERKLDLNVKNTVQVCLPPFCPW